MEFIFQIVFYWLQGLAWVTALSYREINIIMFYIIVPISWVFLYELPKRKFKYTIALFMGLLICVIVISFTTGFEPFSKWFFVKSQDFLNAFPFVPDPDLNYVISSVVICIFIPLFIYFPLIKRNWSTFKAKWKYILIGFVLLNLPIVYGVLKFKKIL